MVFKLLSFKPTSGAVASLLLNADSLRIKAVNRASPQANYDLLTYFATSSERYFQLPLKLASQQALRTPRYALPPYMIVQAPGFLLLRDLAGDVFFLPPDEDDGLAQLDLSDDIVVAELFSNTAWQVGASRGGRRESGRELDNERIFEYRLDECCCGAQ